MKGRPTPNRTRFAVESARQKILAKLRRAGRRGVPRGQFGITKTPYTAVEVMESALDSLVSEGKIAQILTRPIPRFFTVETAPDADRVAEKILDRAEKNSGRLLTITDLENALSDVEKPLAERATASLVETAELVRGPLHARGKPAAGSGHREHNFFKF